MALPEIINQERSITPEEVLDITVDAEANIFNELGEIRNTVQENRSAYEILSDRISGLRVRIDTVEAGKSTEALDAKEDPSDKPAESKASDNKVTGVQPVDKPKDSKDSKDTDKIKVLVKEAAELQTNIKGEFKAIKKDYMRNRSVYNTLYEEVRLLKRKQNAPTFRKAEDPLDKLYPKGQGKKGGLFGFITSLLGGLGIGKLLLGGPISGLLVKGVGKIAGGLARGLTSLVKSAGRVGKSAINGIARVLGKGSSSGAGGANSKTGDSIITRIAKKLGPSGLRSGAAEGANLGLGKGVGRVAIRQVAGFIGRGAIAAAAGTIGFPLLIASSAAAVGFGTYKLAKYLKLSEKLDGFVNKISGGKFKSINDFLLGIVDGTVGKELFGWVKNKIGTMYEDAITWLKDKVNDLLGVLSPFKNEGSASQDTKDGGSTASAPGDTTTADDSSTTSGSSSSSSESSSPGGFWNTLKSIGKKVSNAVFGGSSSPSPSSSEGAVPVGSGELAWKSITNGVANKITSGYSLNRTFEGKSAPHKAIDIAAPIGTVIYAPESGTFSKNTHASGGNQAFVRGKSGYRYGFAHLSSWIAKNGQQVKAGEPIAKSGNTGRSSGPHIHFSVTTPGNVKIDPKGFRIPGSATGNSQGGPVTDEEGPSTANYIARQPEETATASYMTDAGSDEMSDEISAIETSKLRASSMNMPSASVAKPSSVGIGGSTKDVMNPRGGLMQEIVLASTSALFV